MQSDNRVMKKNLNSISMLIMSFYKHVVSKVRGDDNKQCGHYKPFLLLLSLHVTSLHPTFFLIVFYKMAYVWK